MTQLRPLVMRVGAFGDMVLLTGLLRHLHARFGKPVDLISSGPWTQPLLDGQASVGTIFLIRSRRTPYWLSLHQKQLVAWLRARGPGPRASESAEHRTCAACLDRRAAGAG